MFKLFVTLGSIQAFLAVALGAFGAHILKSKLSSEMMQIFQTAVHYQMFHALGILIIAIIAERASRQVIWTISLWSMFVGICLFSGSLYVLSLTGIKMLGAMTPFGGLGFLLGWILVVVALWKS
jgi:uncharacterized membrane protein YgdD (TMEM256/DUF423 family)